ncbi:MAG: M42 family metallopeptidase [Anaerolineales bacterium]
MDQTLELLKELTEAHGISGYEGPVRAVVRRRLEGLGELSQDKMGSVICKKNGAAQAPRVMLAGHMDEVGFMVKHITKDGFLKFLPLGGWFDQVLLSQRVIVKTRKGDIVGVIGAKPPHLLPADERAKVVKKEDMYIDIGATSREEVDETGVRPGDPVIPRADFVVLSNGKSYLSKAFDDRVGTALIISALQAIQDQDHPNTVFGAVTVQEEVGLRGARTSVWAVDPDVAIILESDIAGDVPGIKPEQSSVKLGAGPAVPIYDRSMIPNLKLRDFILDTAEEIGVPVQASYVEAGGTDGGAIHQYKTGVPTAVLGVAARHIHSHSSIIYRDDYDNAVKLLTAIITRMDAETVAGFTK